MPTKREEAVTNYRGPDSEYIARVLIIASPPFCPCCGGQKNVSERQMQYHFLVSIPDSPRPYVIYPPSSHKPHSVSKYPMNAAIKHLFF